MLDKFHIDKVVINFGCSPRRGALGFAFGLPTPKERKSMPVEITLTNEQKVTATLTPVTATGRPVGVDGPPQWSVISGDATLEIAEDGLSATIISPDTPGDSQILVEADADLGEGVEAISDVIKVTVVGAKAASLGLTLGTPEPK